MKILFLVTADRYFWSHRVCLARAARDAGADVYVMANGEQFADSLKAEGFHVVPWSVKRGSINPLRECCAISEVIQAYRKIRPDVVHHVALKPIVYGGIATYCFPAIRAVNAINGLGSVFIRNTPKLLLLRPLLQGLLKLALRRNHSHTIFQCHNDALFLGATPHGIRWSVIRGAGVNTDEFVPTPEPPGKPIVLLPCRMIWDKGVAEFVAAARTIRSHHPGVRFVLAGDIDVHNPSGITLRQLRAWTEEGVVEWWGYRNDMTEVFAQVHIVCLPSYSEGVPKALIEAASCGRPIVATAVGGIPEIVRDGDNGLLVPPQNVAALVEALNCLLTNSKKRARMARRGRRSS